MVPGRGTSGKKNKRESQCTWCSRLWPSGSDLEGDGQWRRACTRSRDAGWRSRMQCDAARVRPVFVIGRQRGGPAWSPNGCAAPSLSPCAFVVFCARRAWARFMCVCVCTRQAVIEVEAFAPPTYSQRIYMHIALKEPAQRAAQS